MLAAERLQQRSCGCSLLSAWGPELRMLATARPLIQLRVGGLELLVGGAEGAKQLSADALSHLQKRPRDL
jgi:hypothetical protein